MALQVYVVADPYTGAIGIKRNEQMQETIRSSNQELITDWLREKEESGLQSLGCHSLSSHQGLRIVEGITGWQAGRQTSKQTGLRSPASM